MKALQAKVLIINIPRISRGEWSISQTMLTYRLTASGLHAYTVPGASSLDEFTRLLPAGFYTTFRTYDERRRVLGLCGHLDRLYVPAQKYGIIPAVEENRLRFLLAQALADLQGEARVRLVLTRQGEIYLAMEPLKPLPAEVYQHGVKVITLPLHRRRPSEKATDFIVLSQQARQAVQQAGAFEGMMVWRDRILEGLTSNFFYVDQGRLGTVRRGVLPGMTRRIVLRLARRAGLEVIWQALSVVEGDREMAMEAQDSARDFRVAVETGAPNRPNRSQKFRVARTTNPKSKTNNKTNISEAFLTSSSRGIVPIVQIDDWKVGDGKVGPITRYLQQAYETYVMEKAEEIVRRRG